MTITNILNKPTQQFNYTDLNQIEAIISGGATWLNYTENTLAQINNLIEYFSRNESGAAVLLHSSNANVGVVSFFATICVSVIFRA